MKNLFTLIMLVALSAGRTQAQWVKQAGINFVPLISQSLEATTEFSHTSWYSITADLGYTFRSSYKGIGYRKYHDFYDDRRSSGVYFRIGPRFYTPAFGPSRKVRFYANPLLVISNYNQRANYNPEPFEQSGKTPVSAKGTVLIPALRIGFYRPLGERIAIDFGVQKAMRPRRDDVFGSWGRNYQPGTGIGERFLASGLNTAYVQGYFALKWRL